MSTIISLVRVLVCAILMVLGFSGGLHTKAQCNILCNTWPTISHNDQGATCGNAAAGECSVALGIESRTDNAAEASVAMGNKVNVQAAYAIGGGDSTTLTDDALRSFIFGEDVTLDRPRAFLVGWNGDPTLFAIHPATGDRKVSLFTDNVISEADFLINRGSVVQDYSAFPSIAGGARWNYRGDNGSEFPFTDGYGSHYQWDEFGASFGLINDGVDPADAIIAFRDDSSGPADAGASNNLLFIWKNGSSDLERMRIQANGLVGMGTTAPTEILDVNGNGRFRSVASGTFANDLSITSNGTLTTSTSDRRLKRNITGLENTLERVLQLEAVSFNWKDTDSDGQDIGFIAQELEAIFPEVVFTNPVDGYMGINYSRFPAILVNAIQEQQQIIESQEARLMKLEEEVSHLVAGTPTASGGTSGSEDSKSITLTDKYEEAPLLYQNVPNPFNQTTAIQYYIPTGVGEATLMFVATGSGKILKTVDLKETGMGQLEINTENLPAGNYSYTLVIDGQQTLSRQMILSK